MKIKIYILTFFFLNSVAIYSQTGTCTVLQQPCNGDGVLVTTVTGMTPPLTFQYYDYEYTQHIVNALSDTFMGYKTSYVRIRDNFQHTLFLNTGMVAPFIFDLPVTTDAICPGLTGTAQVAIFSGIIPDSVQWYHDNLGGYILTGNPVNLPPGGYNVIAYLNGCSAEYLDTSIAILYTSTITFSVNTTTASCTNGTASISNISGGIPPYTILWSNGANTSTISNLTAGSYNVTVTDAQGCYKLHNYINVPQSVVISANSTTTNATCLQNDGSITFFGSGGVPPYTYLYSNGMTGQTLSGLSGSNSSINVIVTDANGCKGYGYGYVSGSTPITVTYSTSPSLCTASSGSATLNISGGTAPYYVDWATYPLQTGVSINNMPSGTYSFKVTDAVGCVRTGTAFIPPQSTIYASVSATNAVCPGNTGNINTNVSGTNPPFNFIWSNASTANMLSNVSPGSYSCTFTDNVGCSVIKHGYINVTSPIGIGFNVTPASCLYASDGSIMANAFGGTPPYTFNWSNGMTGSNISGLASGNYYVYVSDANGCTFSGYNNHTFVGYNPGNDSCYCTIQGKVYVDLNNNCQYDSGEQGVEHLMIHCAGFGYAFTDANGDYSFKVPSGNYTLSESVLYIYPLASCQNNTVSASVVAASGCVSTVNFANIINPLHDIHIIPTGVTGLPIPGFTYTHGLIVQNDGTISEPNIQFGYKHDGQLQYAGSSPNVFTQQSPIQEPNWYSVNTGFPSLLPGGSMMLNVNYNVPPNIPLGTTIAFGDTGVSSLPMSSWFSDYSPWNNVNQYSTYVVGSFDPNFKEVYPKGKDSLGLINITDSVLDYVIHFQNTGSYYAENIVITDTLDPDLNWSTLRPGYSNHEYTATISDDGVLKFTFNNIHLVWKANNEINSRELVSYSIKQNPNLSNGTTILNKANIFFDFNSPIYTNTTLNTICNLVSVRESHKQGINIYPNPTSDVLNVVSNNLKIINIYDISGRLVTTEKALNGSIQKISVEKLTNGIYLLELVKVNGEKLHGKFVKN